MQNLGFCTYLSHSHIYIGQGLILKERHLSTGLCQSRLMSEDYASWSECSIRRQCLESSWNFCFCPLFSCFAVRKFYETFSPMPSDNPLVLWLLLFGPRGRRAYSVWKYFSSGRNGGVDGKFIPFTLIAFRFEVDEEEGWEILNTNHPVSFVQLRCRWRIFKRTSRFYFCEQ